MGTEKDGRAIHKCIAQNLVKRTIVGDKKAAGRTYAISPAVEGEPYSSNSLIKSPN